MQSHLDLSPNDTHVQIEESNATAHLKQSIVELHLDI